MRDSNRIAHRGCIARFGPLSACTLHTPTSPLPMVAILIFRKLDLSLHLGLFLLPVIGCCNPIVVIHCLTQTTIRADFRAGDEDSNFSVLRVRRFSEWPERLHWIAFPVDILTKPLIHWIASPFFTENPFFSLKSASSHPLPKNRLRYHSRFLTRLEGPAENLGCPTEKPCSDHPTRNGHYSSLECQMPL